MATTEKIHTSTKGGYVTPCISLSVFKQNNFKNYE